METSVKKKPQELQDRKESKLDELREILTRKLTTRMEDEREIFM